MQARMTNPAVMLPEALKALMALDKAAECEGLPYAARKMVHLRASQINGCSTCVDMHSRELRRAGESDERIFAVAAWRDTLYYSDAERAAIALAESVTRLNDREDAVPRCDLGGGCQALRRALAGRAGPPDRSDQLLEQGQRVGSAGRGSDVVLTEVAYRF